MDITLSIYITVGPNLVRTMMVVGVTGANHTFSWDGKDNSGSYLEAKPYTYNVSISQLDTNADGQTVWDHATYRSTYLQILRATDDEGNPIFEAEFHEYDDKGTPEEEDDDYIYIVRHYALRDGGGLDASEGEIWLFNPDLDKVKTWSISSLECLKHDGNDGLEADEQGIAHSVLVPVPVGMMNDEGEYIFVVHAKDDHVEYRNHEERWALEMNQTVGTRVLLVEDDWMVKPDGTPLNPIARHDKFKRAFREAGIEPIFLGWDICGPIEYTPFLTWASMWSLRGLTFDSEIPHTLHLIGASYYFPYDTTYGMTPYVGCWWAITWVEKLLDELGGPEQILLVTIHEAGHALGLIGDHNPASYTKNPQPLNPELLLECVMTQGAPATPSYRDYRFCDDCLEQLKKMKW